MIDCCDVQGCCNRKICTVYSTLAKYQNYISVTVNNCQFCLQGQELQRNIDPMTLAEKSKKIKDLQKGNSDKDAPFTVNMAKGLGMKFEVDDQEIS